MGSSFGGGGNMDVSVAGVDGDDMQTIGFKVGSFFDK